MKEELLTPIYQKIANSVMDTIPESWTKVYLYGEVSEGVRKLFYFYYPSNNDKPVHCHDIPERFQISQEKYDALWYQSLDYLKELWDEFQKNGQEVFTNLTIFFDHSGNFKIEYNYEDLSNANDHERSIIWRYKYLGRIPENKHHKKVLDEYIDKEKNSVMK